MPGTYALARFARSTLVATAFLSVLCPGASAQAGRDTVRVDSTHLTRTYQVQGVTVSVARPGLTTGGSSAVTVSVDSMTALPAPSMEQVLRAMPLIQIRTNSRGEAQPALRGSEDRQIAIFMDGVPLTLGWDHRTDLSVIPLTAAQRVTLLRGLSSVLYGPNTLGGVIEVDVARPGGSMGPVRPLSLALGFDQTGGERVSVMAGRRYETASGEWSFRTGAGFHDVPGTRLPQGVSGDPSVRSAFLADADGRRLNSDLRRIDGFVTTSYRGDDGGWASLTSTAFDVSRGVPPEVHLDQPRLWRYPDQRRLLTAVSAGTGTHAVGGGTGHVEASLGVDLGSTTIHAFDSPSYVNVDEMEEADDRVLTFRTLAERSAGRAGNLRASVTYADVNHDELLTPGGANTYRQRLWSLAAESEWLMGPGGRTHVSLGVVVDGADTPESGDKPPVDRLWNQGFRLGTSTLLRGGRVLLHGGLSRRTRFPSLRELYSGALGRFEPNPDLMPEALMAAEAGFTVEGRSSQLQVVGFHHRLSDGIVRVSVGDSLGSRRFMRINQDQVLGTGVEVLAVSTLGATVLSGDLTLQSVHAVDSAGGPVDLEYEPRVYGKLGSEIPLAAGLVGVANFRFVGAQLCENPDLGGLDPLGANRSVDVGIRRRFGDSSPSTLRRMDVSLNLGNATDATVYDQCGLPQPGRTLQLQLRIW
ncbi:MAG: TonB-dependent receptor [Gemmatimonadota bacterium]|nr:TonB-dependent receptor [Gemmatimonadota bacterium]